MAAWVYGDATMMPISANVVPSQYTRLRDSAFNHNITCGRTMDYYASAPRHWGFMIITTDSDGVLTARMLSMEAPPQTEQYDYVEFRGKMYMIASTHVIQGYNYTVVDSDGQNLTRGYSHTPWMKGSTECDDGKLYFASCEDDSAIPNMPDWHTLNVSIPDYNTIDQHRPSICRGENGCVYYVGGGISQLRAMSARPPMSEGCRNRTRKYMGHIERRWDRVRKDL